ncbi:MAG: nucleotide exchange factor GrpE [Lentisphaerae bacterium]|nr:nucleotide exchange factor GrpE [Lentisphaerota bacterium]
MTKHRNKPHEDASSAGVSHGVATPLTRDGSGQPPSQDTTPPPSPASPKETEALHSKPDPTELAKTAQELAALKDQHLRLLADFDNFRKRLARDNDDSALQAHAALMRELLPVLDHLHLGIQAAKSHNAEKVFIDGLQMIQDQMMLALTRFGLTPVDMEGRIFDPNLGDAVTLVSSEEVPEGMVIAQTRRGYKLKNMLLRPAQVVVSQGPAKPADSPEPPESPKDPAQPPQE